MMNKLVTSVLIIGCLLESLSYEAHAMKLASQTCNNAIAEIDSHLSKVPCDAQKNLKYVSNMTLQAWRLYSTNETYEMYFKAAYNVKKSANQTDADVVTIYESQKELEKLQQELDESEKTLAKLQIKNKQVVDHKDQQKLEKQRSETLYNEGKSEIAQKKKELEQAERIQKESDAKKEEDYISKIGDDEALEYAKKEQEELYNGLISEAKTVLDEAVFDKTNQIPEVESTDSALADRNVDKKLQNLEEWDKAYAESQGKNKPQAAPDAKSKVKQASKNLAASKSQTDSEHLMELAKKQREKNQKDKEHQLKKEGLTSQGLTANSTKQAQTSPASVQGQSNQEAQVQSNVQNNQQGPGPLNGNQAAQTNVAPPNTNLKVNTLSQNQVGNNNNLNQPMKSNINPVGGALAQGPNNMPPLKQLVQLDSHSLIKHKTKARVHDGEETAVETQELAQSVSNATNSSMAMGNETHGPCGLPLDQCQCNQTVDANETSMAETKNSTEICPDCGNLMHECTCDNATETSMAETNETSMAETKNSTEICPDCGNLMHECTCVDANETSMAETKNSTEICPDCGNLMHECACEAANETSMAETKEEEICPFCGNKMSECTCETSIAETKEEEICPFCGNKMSECTCEAQRDLGPFAEAATEAAKAAKAKEEKTKAKEEEICPFCGNKMSECTCEDEKDLNHTEVTHAEEKTNNRTKTHVNREHVKERLKSLSQTKSSTEAKCQSNAEAEDVVCRLVPVDPCTLQPLEENPFEENPFEENPFHDESDLIKPTGPNKSRFRKEDDGNGFVRETKEEEILAESSLYHKHFEELRKNLTEMEQKEKLGESDYEKHFDEKRAEANKTVEAEPKKHLSIKKSDDEKFSFFKNVAPVLDEEFENKSAEFLSQDLPPVDNETELAKEIGKAQKDANITLKVKAKLKGMPEETQTKSQSIAQVSSKSHSESKSHTKNKAHSKSTHKAESNSKLAADIMGGLAHLMTQNLFDKSNKMAQSHKKDTHKLAQGKAEKGGVESLLSQTTSRIKQGKSASSEDVKLAGVKSEKELAQEKRTNKYAQNLVGHHHPDSVSVKLAQLNAGGLAAEKVGPGAMMHQQAHPGNALIQASSTPY